MKLKQGMAHAIMREALKLKPLHRAYIKVGCHHLFTLPMNNVHINIKTIYLSRKYKHIDSYWSRLKLHVIVNKSVTFLIMPLFTKQGEQELGGPGNGR